MTQQDFNAGLCAFLGEATTPFHAVSAMARELEAAGFTQLFESGDWRLEPGGRYYLTRNGSSILAFRHGTASAPTDGMRLVGAHTDSPCLMVKPAPEMTRRGYFQLGVEVYGGALLNPWFDRDLSLAGRVSYADAGGSLRSALIDYRDPVAVIPSLAIHLDREVNSNRSINPQEHLPPILCQLGEAETLGFRDLLRQRLEQEHPGVAVGRVLDYELCLYDTQPPAVVGLRGEFIASARLDNLVSCYTGLQALLQAGDDHSALLICNDHEEVGSLSASGAQGPMLRETLRRIGGSTEGYAALVSRSMLISADNAHGVHPNYADRHDGNHGPLLNRGPVIKINANQRYASNSETSGLYRLLAAQEEVAVQSFVVRTDMACGSTIGPITAGETGIRTLDVSVPTFAMHSVRELAGSRDAWDLCRLLRAFYGQPAPLSALG